MSLLLRVSDGQVWQPAEGWPPLTANLRRNITKFRLNNMKGPVS